MKEKDEFNDLPPLVLHEGFILDHDGNMVGPLSMWTSGCPTNALQLGR